MQRQQVRLRGLLEQSNGLHIAHAAGEKAGRGQSSAGAAGFINGDLNAFKT